MGPDPAVLEELRVSKARVDRLGRQSTYLVVVAVVSAIWVAVDSWLTDPLSSTTTTTLFCLLFVTNISWMAKVLPVVLEVRHLRLVGGHTTAELARVKLMLRDGDG